jgi:hypothetical protein
MHALHQGPAVMWPTAAVRYAEVPDRLERRPATPKVTGQTMSADVERTTSLYSTPPRTCLKSSVRQTKGALAGFVSARQRRAFPPAHVASTCERTANAAPDSAVTRRPSPLRPTSRNAVADVLQYDTVGNAWRIGRRPARERHSAAHRDGSPNCCHTSSIVPAALRVTVKVTVSWVGSAAL